MFDKLKKSMRPIKNRRGFTLVECVYAMAVFAIVASFITPLFLRANSEVAKAKQYDLERNAVLFQLENNKTTAVPNFIAANPDYNNSNSNQVVVPIQLTTADNDTSTVLLNRLSRYTKVVEKPSQNQTGEVEMSSIKGFLLYLKVENGTTTFEIFLTCDEAGVNY